MDESLGKCYEESENNNLPKRVCTVALQVRDRESMDIHIQSYFFCKDLLKKSFDVVTWH